MILYCIRHGESTYNIEGRIQGQEDTPLSPLGERQSQILAQTLATLRADAIYASPLRRAMQTAQPLANILHLEPRTDDRLKEIHAGIFQGLLSSELAERYPREAALWRSQDPEFEIPGGESRKALGIRGQAAFEAIRAAGHRVCVVVAHGGVLAAAFKALMGLPALPNPFAFFNASISILEWTDTVRAVALNQTQHLRAAGCELMTKTGDL